MSTYPNHYIFVAEIDGAVVGMFALVIVQQFSAHGGRSAVLEDVVVKTGTQGQGIGSTMMHHAAEFAKAQGCFKLMLSSNKKRSHAHTFYEKLGYVQHGYSYALDIV